MAFGPVNAGGGASGRTIEEINTKIQAAKQEAQAAMESHTAADNPHGITPEKIRAVPVTRKINNKPLSGDVTLGAGDVGAVPVTRKINNKALSEDVTLTAQDVGAAAAVHSHSFESLSGKVFHAGTTAPANTGLLWIDTNTTTGGLKYHNGSAWVHVPVAYT